MQQVRAAIFPSEESQGSGNGPRVIGFDSVCVTKHDPRMRTVFCSLE